MRFHRSHRLAIALICSAALVLPACGGDSDDAEPSVSETQEPSTPAEPGADPFVKVGDVVEPGQTVAIVEAMKLMNQVTADVKGTVAEILVEDGQWVEFEQVLVYLDVDGGGEE